MTPASSSEFGGTERFSVVRRIGAGGMGVVYEVWDRQRETPLALKTLRSLQGKRLQLFKNEFRALQGVSHKNLVGLGELVEESGQWFFTMELVAGTPFLDWVCPARAERRVAETAPQDTEMSTVATIPDRLPIGSHGHDTDGPPAGHLGFDEARLRDGLAQLATGLLALHRHGKIHRDIKPSNVMVAGDGRVVILDFGLVRDLDGEEVDDHVMGTPAYMAPEQATRRAVGPPADWYAVGVMMYAAMTGRLPYLGSIDEVLAAKLAGLPPPPCAIVHDLPADLDVLCMRLLAIDPDLRAGGGDILRALGGDDDEAEVGDTFLGRDAELAALDRALADGGPLAVTVAGESGVGKTTLVARWAARAARAGAVVLSGRCYEREAVPYKAVDGVIDALERWLSGRPDEEVRAIAPPRGELLSRAFPALAAVPALAPPIASPWGRAPTSDPIHERRQLFEALRALLGNLANHHRLVIAIDDLQWADADSLAMLGAILRPPGAPRLLLVVTERADETAGFAPPCPSRRIDVGPLAAADAAALAASLLPAETSGAAAAVASEAGGHPLFVMELARARRRHDAGAIARLEDALRHRIDALGDDRALLEVIALAGAPLPQAIAGEAAGLALGPVASALTRLRAEHLVRTSGAGTDDDVDCYHSRVRDAVLEALAPPRARGLHGALAAALERRGGADPERLFGHWLEAGEPARARAHAIAAADVASSAFAFDRAARLYRAALDLGDDDALALQQKRGQALVDAGRGAEAARAFQDAAAHADERTALDLRRRAAEQLLRSGHVDAGLDGLREVLAAVGMRLPASGRAAIPGLLAARARVRLRGLSLRRGGRLDPDALARVDACWSAAVGLLMVDSVRSALFQSRMLALALDAGDPYRAAIGVALEAGLIAAGGARHAARVERILVQARSLAEESGSPHALGIVTAATGMSAILMGRFADGLTRSEEAAAILRAQPGTTWERDTVATQTSWAQIYLGRFRAVAGWVPDAIREAEERDDRYLATALRTGTLVWLPLTAGDPAGARAGVDEAMRRWSERGFLHQHWDDLLARAELDLHGGDAAGALARMDQGWRSLEKNFVLEIQISREEAVFVHGRAALARAVQLGGDARLIAVAARDARRLRKEGVGYIVALGDLLAAGVAAARGDQGEAMVSLRSAAAGLDASGVAMHLAVARRRLGALLGGDEGRCLTAASDAYFAAEGVVAIDAITAHLAPGWA